MNRAPRAPDGELQAALEARRRAHRYRQRRLLEGPQGPRARVDGRDYLVFCSNDYLGLANHPRLIEAQQRAAAEYGAGSGASHLVCGHGRLHHELEERLAAFTGRDRALLFSTGYMANLGVVTALLGRGDRVFEDRLNHASLLDAGLLSGARFRRFRHNDLEGLQGQLDKAVEGRTLIAVDAVFSMDGDLAPLPELARLAAREKTWLLADDAHGFGVLGEHGAGSAEHFALDQQQLPILMGTLGKALGSFGAFVAGSEALIETLIQFARPYIYTTALPPAVPAATLAALDLLEEESWRRRRGLPLMPSETAIQPLTVGEDEAALRLSEALAERGLLISAIRPPTVPEGSARLRITLSAAHEEADIDRLLEVLAEVVHGR